MIALPELRGLRLRFQEQNAICISLSFIWVWKGKTFIWPAAMLRLAANTKIPACAIPEDWGITLKGEDGFDES